jgi:dihydrofolate synthase/folylpolyglutamate synthase
VSSPILDRLFALETFGIKLGLDNITRLSEALGHPHRRFHTLHVAGTNGKGSVSAMVHAALRAAGIRAGRYTSPHLSDLSERFVLDDGPVDPARLEATVADVLACVDRLRAAGGLTVEPTFFEVTTAVAFELFARAGIDVGVVEVGLGGRFDATNVVSPLAGAITTIDFDHQQHLGPTLADIAFEKAGIIKPGMTLVMGALGDEAARVVRRSAAERGVTLVEAHADTRCETVMTDGRARLTLATPAGSYGPVTLGLRGAHQVDNAIVAVRLLEAAAAGGLAVPREAIERDVQNACRGWASFRPRP